MKYMTQRKLGPQQNKNWVTDYEVFPKKLNILVQIAIVLVTTARIIITNAMVLSLAVDIP